MGPWTLAATAACVHGKVGVAFLEQDRLAAITSRDAPSLTASLEHATVCVGEPSDDSTEIPLREPTVTTIPVVGATKT